jgi:hypothetical protein
MTNGASAYVLLMGGVHNLRLLHDTHHLLMTEEFGPQLWDAFYSRCSQDTRDSIDEFLADPGYQLDVRQQIWGEIGKKPPGPVLTKVDMLRRSERAPAAEGAADATT